MALLLVVGSFVEYGTTGRAAPLAWGGADGHRDCGRDAGVVAGHRHRPADDRLRRDLCAPADCPAQRRDRSRAAGRRIMVPDRRAGHAGCAPRPRGQRVDAGYSGDARADPHRAGRERAVGGGIAHPRLSARFRTRGLSHRQCGPRRSLVARCFCGPCGTAGRSVAPTGRSCAASLLSAAT